MESRKIKFKTLDNKITELEVPQNILIADLKNKIKEKLGMPAETQRLIFKGKQLKDDKNLSEYINADDETVHLMTRMVETTQPSATTTTNASTNTTQQQSTNQSQNTTNTTNTNPFNLNAGAGGNPLQGLLGNLMNNPNSILQMTSMILGDNDLDLNNLLQGGRPGTQTGPGQNQSQPLNLNALLGNILNPNANQSTTSSQQGTTTTATNVPGSTDNTNANNQYPMLNPPNESLSNLENINETWLGDNSSDIPKLTRLNYPKNILTSLGETLRTYHNNINRFLPLVLRLAECLERESLVQSTEERRKVQSLATAINSGFEHISKATGSLQPLLNGLDYGHNPGQGHLRLITTIGTSVVIENTQNQSAGPSTQRTESTSTGTTRANPMQDMLSQLSQPDNMRAMMSMVGNLLGNNSNAPGTNTQTSANANPLNNIFSQLLNNMGGDMMVDNQVPQNVHEYFSNLLNDQNARKTTLIKDIPQNVLKINPNPDFSPFSKDILSLFSVQEIILLKSLNLRGFTRLRRIIKDKISNHIAGKFNNDLDRFVKNLTEIMSQIFIITENETDKMINNNFNLESHIENFLHQVFKIFMNDNLNDAEFDLHLNNILIRFVDGLFKDLIASYNTGKEGALNYLDYNIEYLIEAVIGKEALNVLISLDQHFIGNIIDEIVSTYDNKKDSILSNESELSAMQVDSENGVTSNLEKNRIQEIANLDAQRLSQYIHPIEFSEGYPETGLFKEN